MRLSRERAPYRSPSGDGGVESCQLLNARLSLGEWIKIAAFESALPTLSLRPTMPLAIPGSSASALALALPAAPAGVAKLDPQFHAILCQAKVRQKDIVKLAAADCDTAAVFGHVAKSDERFALFIKRVLNLDPEARGEDAIPAARFSRA